MKRVVQTRTGANGNCLNACIASILELPLKQVPEFGDDWEEDLNDFLADHGLSYRRVPMYKKPSGWSTIEGVSPRGGLHAVVGYDGELIWDPHPIEDGTGQGLVEPRYYGLLEPLLGVTGKELKEQEAKGLDQAGTLTQLRSKSMRKGPFTIQETTKSGKERTIPVRELSKGADASVAGFAMQFNSAATWDSASITTRRGWLVANGLSAVAADYLWNEQTSKVQNAFVDWYRANHNV